MPKITARRCPFTDKIFVSDGQYKKHLKKLRAGRTETRIANRLQSKAKNEVVAEVSVLTTLAEIQDYLNANYRKIVFAYLQQPLSDKLAKAVNEMEVFNIRLIDLRFEERCSNSHHCPRSGERNWCHSRDDQGIPNSYPGFYGSIEYTLSDATYKESNTHRYFPYDPYRINEALGVVGVHTGTGGAGGPRHRYDVRLFLDDFDGLKKLVFVDVLNGTSLAAAGKALERA